MKIKRRYRTLPPRTPSAISFWRCPALWMAGLVVSKASTTPPDWVIIDKWMAEYRWVRDFHANTYKKRGL